MSARILPTARYLPGAILVLCSVVLVCSFLGCGEEVVAPKPCETIFPLTPGTYWQYGGCDRDRVIRSVEVDGRQYSEVIGTSLGVSGTRAFLPLLRVSADSQLVYRDHLEEQILFDFAAQPGSVWPFIWRVSSPPLPYKVTLVRKGVSIGVPAGEFSECFWFSLKAIGAVDADWTVVVAPSYGVVYRRGGFGFSCSLTQVHIQPCGR